MVHKHVDVNIMRANESVRNKNLKNELVKFNIIDWYLHDRPTILILTNKFKVNLNVVPKLFVDTEPQLVEDNFVHEKYNVTLSFSRIETK